MPLPTEQNEKRDLRQSAYRMIMREFAHGLVDGGSKTQYVYCVQAGDLGADMLRFLAIDAFPETTIQNVIWIDIDSTVEPLRSRLPKERRVASLERVIRSSIRRNLRMMGYENVLMGSLSRGNKSTVTRHLRSVTGIDILQPSINNWNLYVQTTRTASIAAKFYGYNAQELVDFFKSTVADDAAASESRPTTPTPIAPKPTPTPAPSTVPRGIIFASTPNQRCEFISVDDGPASDAAGTATTAFKINRRPFMFGSSGRLCRTIEARRKSRQRCIKFIDATPPVAVAAPAAAKLIKKSSSSSSSSLQTLPGLSSLCTAIVKSRHHTEHVQRLQKQLQQQQEPEQEQENP